MPDNEIRYTTEKSELAAIDWHAATADIAADDFDNGRTPDELRLSFERAFAVSLAWHGSDLVSMARLLADGVCNAYLVDVWTHSGYRLRGIGGEVVRRICATVPGHHVALFTDNYERFYAELGFRPQVGGMSKVVGTWLDRPST